MNLTGLAVVFTHDNATVAFSGIATTDNELSGGVSLSDSFDKADLKGAGGRTVARGAANRRHNLTVEVFFKDTSGSPTQAGAKGKAALPTMFGIVTLANFGNALYDGTWNYEGGSIASSTDGYQKATLQLSRSEASNGTPAAMTAVPAS
ncbi:MAG: hypothetical protein J0M24_13785 [Verrucomicrobia bacterium]|nr:hypothetical protein [Verrucomicrobiota bacterium]